MNKISKSECIATREVDRILKIIGSLLPAKTGNDRLNHQIKQELIDVCTNIWFHYKEQYPGPLSLPERVKVCDYEEHL